MDARTGEGAKLDLNDVDMTRLHAAIGHIVVRFQVMELWLAEALAGLLGLDVYEDRYAVMSAMSFRQKVDLLSTLSPRKVVHRFAVDMSLVKNALLTAEEFRNRVVHSVWSVSMKDATWVREKGSLRGKGGFVKASVVVNIAMLEGAAESLRTIAEWELHPTETLNVAVAQLKACEQVT